MEAILKKKAAGGLTYRKGETENVQTERNMVEDYLIVGGTNKQQRGQEAGETQKERELKMIFSQLKTFFTWINYTAHFGQHYKELREAGDNLTTIFALRWSHCMLRKKNLVCYVRIANRRISHKSYTPALSNSPRRIRPAASLLILNLITCKFQSDLRNGSRAYY